MRKSVRLAFAAIACFLVAQSVWAEQFGGSWKGPWYRGMTSGVMHLKVGSGGEGQVHFTNLDGFGEETVPLRKVRIDDTGMRFSAWGEGPATFSAKMNTTDDGKLINGVGEYDGFPIKFELKRQ